MQTRKASLDDICASPPMDMAMLNKLKRKRTDSPEPFSSAWVQPAKKARADGDTFRHVAPLPSIQPESRQQLPAANPYLAVGNTSQHRPDLKSHQTLEQTQPQKAFISSDVPTMGPTSASYSTQHAYSKQMSKDVAMTNAPSSAQVQAVDITPLKQGIENEFNMQILMKHNELRLVDQELAKCQIALEQLRRCELRPYPGAQQLSASMSAGTGPSVAPPPGYTRPTHAAPYGVTDGPYASHYQQWLLPDPQFDSALNHATPVTEHATSGDARTGRNPVVSRKSMQKSFTMPNGMPEVPKSLPNYPVSNRKHKIALLKRSTDNQLIKLVCNHCHRSDFSNAQGFLNHCRIAHKLDYKSQDQAAIDCGQLLDEVELANVPPEALATPAHKPSGSRSASTTTTPFKTHTFVHPMNASGPISLGGGALRHTGPAPVRKRAIPPLSIVSASSDSSSPLVPSSQAPRLSAQFAKYNLGGNFEEAIAHAKQKIDMGAEEVMSPDMLDSASPLTPAAAGARTVMGTSRAGSLAPPGSVSRPPSRKGYRAPASRPRPSPLMQTSGTETMRLAQLSSESPASPHGRSSVNQSPHTVEGNPGLVSDHEDDDHGSASEDEVPQSAIAHSLGVRSGGCTDSMEIDVSVDDDMDEHGVIIRRSSMLSAEDRGMRDAGGSSSRKMNGGGEGA